ncbi:MAG TPA: DUF222 domain-containing protein [Streptosporangiaceae bacterium]|nr:DUF222 domain-containing protein [Streptosporangiaceae bacterium]
MCVPPQSPASTGEALATLDRTLAYLAGVDAASLTSAEQAECLRGLERAESLRTAAQASVLTAFDAHGGFEADGQGSARSWLRWQARITSSAASAAMAWTRRLAAHPAVRDALAGGGISVSWARQVCDWVDLLPESARADAEAILLAAATAGAELADLAGLAEEIRKRTAPPDRDGDDGSDDRSVRLDLYYRGAGRLRGDLTPRCAAALRAVLDALGKKTGPEDPRSRQQRDHDALEEACRRLVAAGHLPDRAGQPTQIQLHMTIDQLASLSGAAAAAADGWAGPGPLAMPGDACDASIVPVVTGHVDHELLDQLGMAMLKSADAGAAGRLGPAYARELILRNAVALLSGPTGLASRLRGAQLRGPATSISLPLDVGTATDTIPPHLRRAVILRDIHCGFPGCVERNCQVHHIIPVCQGGPTSLENLVLGCSFHHLVAIHNWGWKLVLNADGTKTAISPDGSRVLRSHGPPAAA